MDKTATSKGSKSLTYKFKLHFILRSIIGCLCVTTVSCGQKLNFESTEEFKEWLSGKEFTSVGPDHIHYYGDGSAGIPVGDIVVQFEEDRVKYGNCPPTDYTALPIEGGGYTVSFVTECTKGEYTELKLFPELEHYYLAAGYYNSNRASHSSGSAIAQLHEIAVGTVSEGPTMSITNENVNVSPLPLRARNEQAAGEVSEEKHYLEEEDTSNNTVFQLSQIDFRNVFLNEHKNQQIKDVIDDGSQTVFYYVEPKDEAGFIYVKDKRTNETFGLNTHMGIIGSYTVIVPTDKLSTINFFKKSYEVASEFPNSLFLVFPPGDEGNCLYLQFTEVPEGTLIESSWECGS